MPVRNLQKGDAPPTSDRPRGSSPGAPLKNGNKALKKSIEEFISNGLKLQDELMVNHEAIEAAKLDYLAEYQRKRQLGR